MSINYTNMCNLLIEDNFGKIVSRVANVIMKYGPLTLEDIVLKTRLPIPKVKDCIKILIQHNFLYYETRTVGRSGTFYNLYTEDIPALIRYPKFLSMIQKIGVEPCHVLEEIIRAGQVTASKILYIFGYRCMKEKKFKSDREKTIELSKRLDTYYQALKILTERKYIRRTCIQPDVYQPLNMNMPELTKKYLFTLPDLNLFEIVEKLENQELNLDELKDSTVFWKVNLAQFYDEVQAELIVEMLNEKFSGLFEPKLALEALFKCGTSVEPFAEETSPVPLFRLKKELEKTPNTKKLINDLSEHLELIDDFSHGLINEIPTLEGSSFIVNLTMATELLMWSLVEIVVTKRHGMQALRVFRLIKTHKYTTQEKIAQISMLPSKDAKQMTYKLIADKFVILKEMRKSYLASAMNNKVEYCFCIDLEQIAYQLYEDCAKGIINTKIRIKDKRQQVDRLIRKQDRIQKILVNMVNQGCSEEQLKEIHDLITPPERVILGRLEAVVDKLTTGIFNLDNSAFIISMFLHYRNRENKKKAAKTRATSNIVDEFS